MYIIVVGVLRWSFCFCDAQQRARKKQSWGILTCSCYFLKCLAGILNPPLALIEVVGFRVKLLMMMVGWGIYPRGGLLGNCLPVHVTVYKEIDKR